MFPLLYHTHHCQHPEDIPFWLELAQENPGPVLELGCGTGRVLTPLAQAGHSVFGMDKDFEMLAFLNSNLPSNAKSGAHVFQADFTSFHLGKRFVLIIMPCNTFSTLTLEQRISTHRCVMRHLEPAGCFTISMPNPELLKQLPKRGAPELEDIFTLPASGEPVQVISSWERAGSYFTFHWHYDRLFPDGKVLRFSVQLQHHLVPVQAYLDEFHQAGMTSLTVYGDYDRSTYHRDSPSLIISGRL